MPGLTEDEAGALRRATEHALNYRAEVSSRPIPPGYDPAEAERRFWWPLPDEGETAEAIIEHMAEAADGGLFGMSSPGFFGYVLGAAHPVGLAADALVGGWNQVTGYAGPTPVTAAMERAACDWVIDLLGLPADSGAGIVTGATLANTCGVIAGRHALLRRMNWDVEADGLYGAPEIQVVIGAEAHSATHAALRYAGLGSKRVHTVPADAEGRMRVEAFAETINALTGPIMVILQSGHINSCAQDRFAEIIPIARREDAWVHVDGAFGLWVHAVPELAERAAGVDLADSWAVDLHKWLNAPYDAGMVIVRDRAPLLASMSAKGAYLPAEGAHWDPNDTTMELSRRARGVPSYAILRYLGSKGVREMVARHCDLARRAADALAKISGVTVLNDVVGNQVAITCGSGAEGDAVTERVLARVQAGGKVYPSHGEWRDRKIIRISVIGYATTEQEIDLLVSEITAAWEAEQSEIASDIEAI